MKRQTDVVTDKPDELWPINEESRPNLRPLWIEARELSAISLNVKSMRYEVTRSLSEAVPRREGLKARFVGLACKRSTQADFESDWAAYWLAEMKIPVLFNCRFLVYAYLLQALHGAGMMLESLCGLGFGCGAGLIASYLAWRGIETLITDLQPEVQSGLGWRESIQYAHSRDAAFHGHLVNRSAFEALVRHRFVDMNAIPQDLKDFDFCWSIWALGHLGSIERCLVFIRNALETLEPGGLAVHTNFHVKGQYITVEQCCFNGRISNVWRVNFAHVDITFLGSTSKSLDRFIDVPPYEYDWTDAIRKHFGGESRHLKLSIDGFPSTCFIVTKGFE